MDLDMPDSNGQIPDQEILFQLYRHQNGNTYTVTDIMFDAERELWCVCYTSSHASVNFIRSYENFRGLKDGKPRFTPV